MDKKTEETLNGLFERAGLKLSEKDRERFVPMVEAYLAGVKRLHAINLGGEELGPVFNPDSNE